MDVGLDRVLRDPKRLREWRASRVGLLAHAASVDRRLVSALDALADVGVRPTVVFGPEHGFGGAAQDMAAVDDEREHRSGARVVSLYGDSFERLSPQPDELEDVDVLVVDLQDVGARYYTFVWTALLALRACARHGVRVVVLDRPNPIDGVTHEGAPHAEARLCSFVGLTPIPIRHGRTIGELLRARADAEGSDGILDVVAVQGWDRRAYGDEWDRPFVMPSPNMPTVETAVVYPGGCLLEATNLSEGRGTTRPFEIFGAPWIDGRRLADSLHATGLDGFRARPLIFRPTFHKFAGTPCGGVEIHVTDRTRFRPVATYLAALTFARAQSPDRFALRSEPYEYVDPGDAPALDLLCGTVATRETLLAGRPWREVVRTVCEVPESV